jgi:hypothetical protein
MGKVTYSSAVSEIRGNVGSLCYSRTRGGAVVRARLSRVAGWSNLQNDVRDYAANVGVRWNATLTDAGRRAWNSAASTLSRHNQLKQAVSLTGQQYYFKVNFPYHWIWEEFFDAPPSILTPNPIPTLAIDAATATPQSLLLNFNRTPDADEAFYVRVTNPMNPGVTSYGHRFSYCKILYEPNELPFEAQGEYNLYHPPLVEGKKLAFTTQVHNHTTAALSLPLLTTCIIAA